MALVTRCPKCESEYEVTADQLKLHDGLVRCGQCSHVFDGFACLKEALPTLTRKLPAKPADEMASVSAPVLNSLVAPAPASQTKIAETAEVTQTKVATPSSPINSTPVSSGDGPFVPSVDRQVPSQPATQPSPWGRQEPALHLNNAAPVSGQSIEPSFGRIQEPVGRGEPREPSLGAFASRSANQPDPVAPGLLVGESRVKGDDPSAFGRTVPEFLEDDEPASEGASVAWLLGAIVLALALIFQSLVVFRNDIVAAAPSLRPLLVQLCKPTSCDVSYVRQIDRIFIVGSSLQQANDAPVTGSQRAYVLKLTLQNRAAFAQPWPALLLTLTDASGTAVVKKALLPSEFLPPNLLDGPMASRQEVGLDIPLTVEGLNISGYELERFFP